MTTRALVLSDENLEDWRPMENTGDYKPFPGCIKKTWRDQSIQNDVMKQIQKNNNNTKIHTQHIEPSSKMETKW